MSDAQQTSASPPPHVGHDGPPLFRNVSFHLLWSSTFASGLADRLITNASWKMMGVGGGVEGVDETSMIAAVDFFFFLPYIVWSPFAGWLVDRLPRKWVMFAADETRGLLVLLAFAIMPVGVVLVPEDHHWKILSVMFAVGVMAATFTAAKLSIVPNVVGFHNLQRANSMVVSMGVIGNLLGFLVSAWLSKAGDVSVRWMVIGAALCYIGSGFFWVFLRTPYKPRGVVAHGDLEAAGGSPLDVLRQIAQGAKYAMQRRRIRVLIVAAAIVWGGTSIFLPAIQAMNKDFFGGQDVKYFVLLFMVGFGMLLGSVLMAVVSPRRGGELLMTGGMIATGLCIGLQMACPWYYPALVIALLTGVGATVLLIPLYSLLQRITADHIRGRVFAAKEILVETPKVALSLLIWQLPKTDEWMRHAGFGLSAVLLIAAAWGVRRYVLTGPAPSGYLNFMWRLSRLIADAVHRVRVIGKHRVPSSGPVIIVSNHTAGVDPLIIQSSMHRMVRYLITKEYMVRVFGFHWRQVRTIAVDRKARDAGALREAIRAVEDGDVIGIFPEGGIEQDRSALRRFVPGVGVIAAKTGAPIVPVFIAGTPFGVHPVVSNFTPSHTVVVFGEPFTLDESFGRDERIEAIRSRIESLRPIADHARQPRPSAIMG